MFSQITNRKPLDWFSWNEYRKCLRKNRRNSCSLDLLGQFYKSLYMNYTRYCAHQQPHSITLEEQKPTFHVQYASYVILTKFRDNLKGRGKLHSNYARRQHVSTFPVMLFCKTVARIREEQDFVPLTRWRTADRRILTAEVQASHSTCLGCGFLELD